MYATYHFVAIDFHPPLSKIDVLLPVRLIIGVTQHVKAQIKKLISSTMNGGRIRHLFLSCERFRDAFLGCAEQQHASLCFQQCNGRRTLVSSMQRIASSAALRSARSLWVYSMPPKNSAASSRGKRRQQHTAARHVPGVPQSGPWKPGKPIAFNDDGDRVESLIK